MPGRPRARRYAKAVFELALEGDALDGWARDLDLVAAALEDADFAALLEAPQVPEGVKYQGIETVLAEAGRLARNLLSVLVQHHQPRLASQIRDQYQALVDDHRGVARAQVTTAVALDDRQREGVRTLLGDLVEAEVVMQEQVEAEIIGGLIARIGDRLIDGSTRTRLQTMRETLARPPLAEAAASSDDS